MKCINLIKSAFLFSLSLLVCLTAFSQKNDLSNFPDSADSKHFLDLLYGQNNSINDPYSFTKIEFGYNAYFTIAPRSMLRNYYKQKFHISESIAQELEIEFYKNNKKLDISDTTYFLTPPQKSIYPFSIIAAYQKLPFLEFLNKYVRKDTPITIFAIGYLFEKRLQFDLSEEFVSAWSRNMLANKYGVYWNREFEKWELKNQ